MEALPKLIAARSKISDRLQEVFRRYRGAPESATAEIEKLREDLSQADGKITQARDAREGEMLKQGALTTTAPFRVGEWQRGEDHEYMPRIPVYDDIGDEVFDIEAEESSTDVKSVRALALANEIVKAINMHDRLVAYLKDTLPLSCTHLAAGGACEGCDRGECDDYRLLKEARGDK